MGLNSDQIIDRVKRGVLTPEAGYERLVALGGQPEPEGTDRIAYFAPDWEESSSIVDPGKFPVRENLLIFDWDDTLRKRLAGVGGGSSDNAVLVRPGERFQKMDLRTFAIRPGQTRDYEALVEALHAGGHFPAEVLHLWSRERFAPDAASLARQVDLGFGSVSRLVRTLWKNKPQQAVSVVYGYPDPVDEPQPPYAAMSAFAQSVRLENPLFRIRTVGFSREQEIPAVAAELCHPGPETAVRYRHGRRWTRRLKALDAAPAAESQALPVLKEGGVYLLTGGTGGLGRLFASDWAASYGIRLVLTGRTEPYDGRVPGLELSAVSGAAAEVVYLRADLSDPGEVRGLIRAVKERFRRIDGILHMAGTIRDGYLLNQSPADIQAVLNPKVYGTLHLDAATRDEAIDFFVLFSSVAAVFGNPGQSDYAFANSFMDHFAGWRERLRLRGERFGRTVSINWPPWTGGGMSLEEADLDALRETTGLKPIDRKQGLEMWHWVLSRTDARHIVPLYGDPERIRAFLRSDGPGKEADAPRRPAMDTAALKEKTIRYVRRVLATLLKVPEERIEPDTGLEAYGINSVLMKQFNSEMEPVLGKMPKTLLFEYQTIEALSGFFLDQYRGSLERLLHEPPSDTATAVSGPSADLSRKAAAPGGTAADAGEVAVIGIAGRYAGSPTLAEFWEHLKQGKDLIREVPLSRWNWRDHYAPDPESEPPGKTHCKWGSFLDDVDRFDPLFFSISPKEATFMDPQERVFLETAWAVFEGAGYPRRRLRGLRVGVFAGVTTQTYPTALPWSIANRVSYFFDLSGPSMPVDTACSSSLFAVHLACESLHTGGCDMALAGGVNLYLHPSKYIQLSRTKMLSPSGRCRSFGAHADGFVPGEGVGAVLLKPLARAVADGDRIHAVIKASSVNHGGKTTGYTVPNPAAHAALISEALDRSGIAADTIGYVEAHGTGTELGDPVEIRGLTLAYKGRAARPPYCAVGSVKSNIGHLEAAAGIAGLTKIVLQMQHRQLVPSLHAEPLNPAIDFEGTPFRVQRELASWDPPEVEISGKKRRQPRRAAISSFGAGGANAHLIVEEFDDGGTNGAEGMGDGAAEPQLVVLSAKTEGRLRAYAKNLSKFLADENRKSKIEDVAFTLQTGREAMAWRLAVIAADTARLKDMFARFGRGEMDTDSMFFDHVQPASDPMDDPPGAVSDPDVIRQWMEDRNLSKLAESWVRGTDMDWSGLHRDRPARMIQLPTYPFAGKRYWIADTVLPFPATPPLLLADPETVSPAPDHEVLFFEPRWEASAPGGGGTSGIEPPTASFLLLDADARRRNRLKRKAGASVVLVRPGEDFHRPDADTYTVDAGSDLDFTRLLQDLDREDRVPETLAHFWCLGPDTRPELGISSCYALLKALAAAPGRCRRILFFYGGSQAQRRPYWEAVAGFSRSLKFLLPRVSLSTVQVPDAGKSDLVDILMQEAAWARTDPAREVRYEGGTRLVRSFRTPAPAPDGAAGFREGGVYLITGGAGGLGTAICRYLTETYHARVILAGRSPLDGARRERIDGLRRSGADVTYVQADVTDPDAASGLIRDIRTRAGRINGVLHAAGLFSEPLLTETDRSAFESVLAPKTAGTIHLDHATRNECLDCFVLFSSASAVLGDFGQCSYAVANRFLDGYARYRETLRADGRRWGKTLSINWPLWREGGMHRNDASEQFYLKTSGLAYLETKDGLNALEKALRHPRPQTVVLTGDRRRIQALLDGGTPEGESGRDTGYRAPRRWSGAADGGGRLADRVCGDIRIVAADILQAAPEELDIRENLGNFGFDSITLKQFAEALERRFHVRLQPSIFFSHSDIASLGDHLLDAWKEPLMRLYGDRTAELPAAGPAGGGVERPAAVVAHPGVEKAGSRKRWIAVVGAYGVLPGSVDLSAFWRHLEAGDDLVTRVPRDRWDRTDPDVPETDDPAGWGGFITGVDRFDPLFFAISPREAQLMDPQHRLFLECVWKTVEDAGYSASALSGKRVGVFAGIQFNDYEQLMIRKWTGAYQTATGNARTMLANRVSFQMNWHGPSETIDTACSSSLVAVHRAVASLRAGECELAVAGGVSLLLTPGTLLGAARLGVLSPSGRCRTFDKDADGYVKGEGLGAVLLKPLERAVRDRDHVYGVIRGSAVNHGGRAHSLTAPNARAQAELLRAAFADACVDPRTLSYIEVHGTGTELGDPVEVDGIRQAFETGDKGVDTAKVRKTCGLGTVKTNIGHLEPAAGIAGLLKVLLALKHGKLPATLHLRQVNPYISLEDTPLYIVETTRPWARIQTPEKGEVPRRAGISSFGFGGTNAHVVVEEYRGPAGRLPPSDGKVEAQLIVLSARNEERLNVYAERMVEFLRIENRKSTIENIAYTLQTGREAMSERLAVVADSVDDLKKKLSGFVRGERGGSGVFRGAVSHRPSDAAELVRGEEGEAFVGMLLQNRNLDKLARLWVSGTEPDWTKLHGDSARRRIPLPTYPFAAERYWIPEPDADSAFGVMGRHPLIDEVDLSSSLDRGIVFGKTLKPTDPIVRDHRVRHQPLMPGDAYLEMVHAAQSMVEPGRRYKFVRLAWRKPLAVDRAEKRVALVLRRKEDQLAFTVQDREGPKPTVYATGELHPVETAEGSEPPRMSIEAIQAACTLEMEQLPFYRRFRDMGVIYDDCFMGVQHIWGNDREALGRLCLPAAAREQLPRMTFNPALTDSALQTIAGIGLSHNSGAQPTRVHYAVDEVELLHPLPAEGYAHARQVDRDRFDVSVLDDDGRTCLRFNGIRVGEIPDPLQGLLFKPRWVPVLPVSDPIPASSVAEPVKGQQTTLIFYPPESMGLEKALAALYPEDRVHRIRLGRRNRVYSRHAREIDVHDPEGPARCLNGFSRIHRIFFLGGRPGSQAEPDDLETLAAIQEAGIITLFRLVRSLVRDPSVDAAPTLTVLTQDGYGSGPDSPVNPYSGSLTGFTRVLALECPRLHAAVVDVRLKGLSPKPKPSRLKDLLLPVVEHVHRSRRPVEAVLEQGRWYERILEPVRLPFTDRIPFRDRGVYLILGGAGGIGTALGKYLAELVHARLVLVGRRPMDDGVKERMARIEAAGGEVLYIRADAADLQGMKAAVAEAKSRFGRIDGVFHSAIVLKDRSLAAMDEETFRDALGPKVAGSVVLYRVFRSEPIDFMVFFSSLQSLTGNPGQSNYAAACSFKDAYALYLRKKAAFPVRLVNWGYWGSVGIVADARHRKRMADQGVGSVEPEEGLEAIRRILNHRIPQAAPFRMDPKTMDGMGIDRSYELILYPDSALSVFDAVVARIRSDAVKKKRPPSSSSALDELDRFGRSLLWDAFQRMGAFRKSGETTTLERLAQAAQVAPGHHRLLEALVELLIRAGRLERREGEVKTFRTPSAFDDPARREGLEAEKDRLCSAHADLSPHIRLLWTCLSRYPEILTGNIPATDILFENAGLDRVEGIYKNNAGADSYNRLVADAVGAFVESRIAHLPEKEKIRILEIGAGTGGTSDAVLRALEPYANRVHFVYTDISRRFVEHGKKHYGDRSFADFRVLDIEGDLENQGYGPGTCDLVLATNVFHATRNIRQTLRNAKCLLKTHGCLVLNETTKVIEFNTLTFGLLEGWWKFEDPDLRIEGSPLLDPDMWDCLLQQEGYERTACLTRTAGTGEPLLQDVFMAESNGEVKRRRKRRGFDAGSAETPVAAVSGARNSASLSVSPGRVPNRPSSPPGGGRSGSVGGKVREIFARILNMAERQLDPDTPYTDYGVDSILAMDIVNRLNSDLAIRLRTTDLFNYPTLKELSRHIREAQGQALPSEEEVRNASERDAGPLFERSDEAGGRDLPSSADPEALSDDAVMDIFHRMKSGAMDLREACRRLGENGD